MDVMTAIKERRSIRRYSQQPVEDEKLLKVLEAARLSPSAKNAQAWKFIVVRDKKAIAKIASTSKYTFIGQAPIILVSCGTEAESVMLCGQYRYTVDLSIATAYMILEAYEQGLGTCWIGSFDETKVKEILGIPENVRVVAITPLGYPLEVPVQRPRKSLEDIVCYELYK